MPKADRGVCAKDGRHVLSSSFLQRIYRQSAVSGAVCAGIEGDTMSNRLVFAVAVPVVAFVIVCILGVDIIGAGFAGEGCRSHDGPSVRWSAAGETALVQLLFGIGFGMGLGVLSAVLNARCLAQGMPRTSTMPERAAIIGYLILSVGLILEQAGCQMPPYNTLGRGLISVGVAALAAYHVLLIVAYLRGLAKGP
jgi:hypothetical protein